ncbi:hypothetical protein [Streptomyces phaeoluteigriseus]
MQSGRQVDPGAGGVDVPMRSPGRSGSRSVRMHGGQRHPGLLQAGQAFLDLVRVPVPFDEVQHHQDVGDEPLGARVEGAPADRGGNPQAVLAVPPVVARAGADVVGDALLVDPQEPLGLSGLQGEGDQVAGLGDERVQAPPGRFAGPWRLTRRRVAGARHRQPALHRPYGGRAAERLERLVPVGPAARGVR